MRRIFSIFLLLLLTGCAAAPTPPPELPPPDEEPALTVNGREVPLWLYRYWMNRACEQAEAADQEHARRQAIADTALCAVVDAWAQDWGVALTAEDHSQLEILWQHRAETHGGEDAYLEFLAQQGLTGEQARRLAETGQRYHRLHSAALDPDRPASPSDGELAAFAQTADVLCAAQLRTAGDDARHRIEQLFSRLNAAPEPQAAFFQLAEQEAAALPPQTFLAGDGTLPPALENAVECLQPGQHSGILKASDGFTILLRLPPEREALIPLWLDSQLLNAAKSAEIQMFPALSESIICEGSVPAPGKFP